MVGSHPHWLYIFESSQRYIGNQHIELAEWISVLNIFQTTIHGWDILDSFCPDSFIKPDVTVLIWRVHLLQDKFPDLSECSRGMVLKSTPQMCLGMLMECSLVTTPPWCVRTFSSPFFAGGIVADSGGRGRAQVLWETESESATILSEFYVHIIKKKTL